MSSRLQLQKALETVLGSEHVYFQPPESMKLSYPCIVYSLGDIKTTYADNEVYRATKKYDVTFITRNPDNTYATDMLTTFSMCRFDRRYIVDNLYHDVFSLYY